jgi:hypothetical protein
MSNTLYRVIFQGQVRAGCWPERVREEVAHLLRCDETTLSRLFSGQAVVIKDEIESETARNVKAVFEKTGALCFIKPVSKLPRAQSPPLDLTCPKCGLTQAQSACCIGCGIVVEKFLQRQSIEQGSSFDLSDNSDEGIPAGDPGVEPFPMSASGGISIKELLLSSSPKSKPTLLLNGLLLLVLLFFSVHFAFSTISANSAGESFLHLINLPFHEAGHIIFRPFGRFMTSLGGSLSQVLFPLICLGVLLLQTRDAFGAGVCLWWTGQNFMDLAPYINDARAGVLPLVGGNTGQTSPYGFHDWEFILTETGLLKFDHTLAGLAHCFGSVIMLLGIVWGGLVLYRNFRSENEI